MIFLNGSINIATAEELQREADYYAQQGWELRDPTTHQVRLQIAREDIDALCAYLKALPADRKPKVWTDRKGERHEAEAVSIRLKGTEMAGNWTKLRACLDERKIPAAEPSPYARQAAPRPAQQPVSSPQADFHSSPASAGSQASSTTDDDFDIPF